MTYQEIIRRLGRLDIRDAEPDDYIALYMAIELLKDVAKGKENETKVLWVEG